MSYAENRDDESERVGVKRERRIESAKNLLAILMMGNQYYTEASAGEALADMIVEHSVDAKRFVRESVARTAAATSAFAVKKERPPSPPPLLPLPPSLLLAAPPQPTVETVRQSIFKFKIERPPSPPLLLLPPPQPPPLPPPPLQMHNSVFVRKRT